MNINKSAPGWVSLVALIFPLLLCLPASAQQQVQQIVPSTPAQIYSNPGGYTGTNGSTGGGADCNVAWEGEGQPTDGGAGGAGTSYNTGTITGSVDSSYGTGIVVTSTGGTGGTGGYGQSCYSGYGGGAGGAGGNLAITYGSASTNPQITVAGSGIIAQSQGGAGGTGGDTGSTLSAGDGGRGGTGGPVTIDNYGTITTSNQYAFGLYGLSLGGNGGSGGKNFNNEYGSGGSGKLGGYGGLVTINNYGAITSSDAYALLGISSGGYGGNAGTDSGFVPSPDGAGAGGGPGGNVTLNNSGSVTTDGQGQAAVVALSVGGGGGDAGRGSSLTSLGNTGGQGADSGVLSVSNSGTVQTLQTGSVGLVAVGVGGGGGSGGMAANAYIGGGGSGGGGGDGATITVTNTGKVCTGGGCSATEAQTTGGLAPAIAAVSVGGGGGMGGFAASAGYSASIAMGGSGGDGGDGGTVLVSNTNTLQTTEMTSAGVLAASVGGGGGAGGGAFAASAGLNASMSLAMGGAGGSGGNGGTVGVNCGQSGSNFGSSAACTGASSLGGPVSGAAVTTYGSSSPGLLAMSIGGGGGWGGFSLSFSGAVASSTSVSVGGKGGDGGSGGAVYGGTAGVATTTSGAFSVGLMALSVGGGGGHGGMTAYTPDYVPGGAMATMSTAVSIGGSGGSGGAGGAVMAENYGATITTNGDRADGVFAGSIGGRGGHGGLASGGATAVQATSVSVGGYGGDGNKGGAVTVNNSYVSSSQTGAITTNGADSHAIEAISIGGGGGSGGWSGGAGVSVGPSTSLTVGGTGGSGGDGGAVNVTNSATLDVNGRGGAGILALSVGGGGGNGGSSASGDVSLTGAFSATVGGNGAGGASGGTVTVTNSGSITTGLPTQPTNDPARASQGIVGISVGGGGGRGGVAVGADLTIADDAVSPSLTDSIGGGSGNGGNGSTVTITNKGSVQSYGDLSNAVTGMSIGGRGGLGGIAISGAISSGLPLNETLGSPGGNGGSGGTVNVSNYGSIISGAYKAMDSSGQEIEVGGFRAMGLVAQSMGGHGGMGGISIGYTQSAVDSASGSVTLGGGGGNGGTGGAATATNETGATISTNGGFAGGMIAQSLGGNGGIGGMSGGASTTMISPSMTLGGNGGGSASGGMASAVNYGTVTTSGLHSVGMLAQSIGGNGGLSGATLSAGSADRAGQFGISQGNSGGNGSNGGAATATNDGVVSTSGALSAGVSAESIGGGGGRAGAAFNLSALNLSNLYTGGNSAQLGASGGGSGDGGAATLTVNGQVTTSGVQSEALYAGSISGGGGSSGLSFLNLTAGSKSVDLALGGQNGTAGDGGSVTANINNTAAGSVAQTIETYGAFSHGLLAQSIGGGGGNATGLHSQSASAGMLAGTMRLGGTGNSGSGGAVNVTTGGTITSNAIGSAGIIAQSVGGGGGQTLAGLINLTMNIKIPDTPFQLTAGTGSASASNGSSGSSTTAPSTSLSLTGFSSTTLTAGSASGMSLGGFSTGDLASGGAVNVTSSSTITTAAAMSDGIKVQSIGNGGGVSGFADVLSGSPYAGSTMSLGAGNSGGGDGGTATVTNSGVITTSGPLSTAILAQSIGGGGGDGRHTSIAQGGLASAFVANMGLQAEAYGGYARDVSVTNTGRIYTSGLGSDGIVAQGIGGGGGISALTGSATTAAGQTGAAGSSQAGTTSSAQASGNAAVSGMNSGQSNTGSAVANSVGASMAATLGGTGGSGALANNVTVSNEATVATGYNSTQGTGDGALGIIAQAIGAGGGIVRHHISNFDLSQSSVALTLGGMKNAGGDGGAVEVTSNYTSSNSLNTNGHGATALLAQSIGGGGGLGMFTGTTSGVGGSLSTSLTLGNAGSNYGSGETVSLYTGGTITTAGDQAEGIIAQSISDGGGVAKVVLRAADSGTQWSTGIPNAYASSTRVSAGTDAGVAIGALLGSQSDNGGYNGNDVTITSNSAITTSGVRATGIVAQSISAGGGLVDVTTIGLNGGNLNAQLILGGSVSGNSGSVSVSSGANITTNGAIADGILAQSITGGGGSFGLSHTSVTHSGAGQINFDMGASAQGADTNADTVTVTSSNSSSTSTSGFGSTGVTAQSIGAGGGLLAYNLESNTTGLTVSGRLGNNSNSSGNGGDVSVSVGDIATSGEFAHGVVAQSIGGGGGRIVGSQGATNISLGAGSSYGGDGGTVTVTNSGSILTTGSYSHGMLLQSIGAGGGLMDIQGTNVAFGTPSAFGASSTVTANVNSSVGTQGYGSVGVLAQSIAGGGGLAVASNTISFGASTNSGGYNAGNVDVNVNNPITTSGNASPGVVAFSGGGGGGVAIVPSVNGLVVNTIHGNGNGGDVTVDVNQAITTHGSVSQGVIAASFGGGGGLLLGGDGDVSMQGVGNGDGGKVAVNIANGVSILTYGSNSTAVWTISSNGKDDPEVNVGQGATVMGGQGGKGILLSGAINQVNNFGSIGTFDGVLGRAVESDGGTTTINNGGLITGTLALGGSGNIFNNQTGGVLNAGSVVDLGPGGVFNNSGLLIPGGGDWRGTTTLTGDLNQLSGGKILVAMRPDNANAAKLNVEGNVAVTGKMGYAFDPTATVKQGNYYRNGVLTATGTLNTSGLSIDQTALVRHNLIRNGQSLDVDTSINFSPLGMSYQGSRFGQALAVLQAHGSTPLMNTVVRSLITVPDVGTVDRAYSSLDGDAVSSVLQTGLQTAQGGMYGFAEQADRWRASGSRPRERPWKTWIAPYGGFGNLAANTGNLSAQFYGGTAGIDVQVTPDTLIGVGGLYGQNQLGVSYASMAATQDVGGAGFYGITRFGQAYLSGASYIGGDRANVTRSFGGFGTANGVLAGTVVAGRVEAGYTIPFGMFQVTPLVVFEPAGRWQGNSTEKVNFYGFQEPGLTYNAQLTRSMPLIGGAQLDTDIKIPDGSVIMTFLRAGFVHEFNTNRELTKSLSAFPDTQFTTGGNYAVPNAAIVRAGAQHKISEHVSLFAYTSSLLSQRYQTLGGNAGLMVHW